MPRPLLRVAAAALAVGALTLAGCSTTQPDDGPTAGTAASDVDTGAFPVTMKHTLGTTTIESAPTKVVTLGWGVTEATLAVGVKPTAMEYQVYGAGDDGIEPWVETKLADMGGAQPKVLKKTTEAPDYDGIRKSDPDLILATYSGITAEQYQRLSGIAPTVGYTGEPYTTSWRDNITQVAEALGRSKQGAQVLAGIDKQIAAEAADHPELEGKTLAAVWDTGGTFYVYKKADARVGFLLDLGLVSAPSVDSLANGDETFYYTLSYEKADQVSSDIIVTYADTPTLKTQFLNKTYAKGIPAVKTGAVATVVGTDNIAAVSPPTALSLPEALPSLVDQLSAAAKQADAADS